MKILVISLAGIGDTLFATPLIHELRENFPDARIDALLRWPGSKQVLEGNPCINTVYQQDFLSAPVSESLALLAKVRRNRYDVSLNVHPQSRRHYRIVARIAGARTRVSHDYDHSGWLDGMLVNRTVAQDYSKHCVENDFALLELIGGKLRLREYRYEIFLSETEEKWAAEFILEKRLDQRQLLGIHVGTGGTKNLALRRWPLENYIQLINRLTQSRPDWSVLLFGGPEERAAHETILKETASPQVLEPRGKNIRHTAALLRRCHSFLSVDTMLMHLAAAVNVPRQFVVETPTFNKTVEPYGQRFVLIPNPAVAGRNLEFYRYDGHGIRGTRQELLRCMQSVPVDAVISAILR